MSCDLWCPHECLMRLCNAFLTFVFALYGAFGVRGDPDYRSPQKSMLWL